MNHASDFGYSIAGQLPGWGDQEPAYRERVILRDGRMATVQSKTPAYVYVLVDGANKINRVKPTSLRRAGGEA